MDKVNEKAKDKVAGKDGAASEKRSTVITISREFGSGGRVIGSKVAERLGIPFYDRKIIELSAEKSGLAVDFVESTEQKVRNKFFHNITFGYMGAHLGNGSLSLADRLFIATSEIIDELAEKGPCVIVGRCADYVLRDRTDVLHVFVYADDDHKVRRAIDEYGLEPDKALGEINRTNKYRANHYNYYTDRVWGARENYHLCLDSGFLGIDNTVDIIVDTVNDLEKQAK